ncbi:bifunctional folylpolyglutamate synthase/dihydrofolate synthase [bacterium]|nr:MAG: bifunctional folylpolyglutamate synthase/dihydrofolate synthase [bacterium]
MTYDDALATLNALEGRGWRLGLDRMRAFVERAGLSSTLSNRGYVHVAGTNGKGTTTAFVESILRHQGWRTGAFYSPYVVDYRERIQANGKMIPPHELTALVEQLMPVADAMADTEFGGATKFELEAAMGLAYWEEKGCDWVALEVGLGGRLDATNVVTPRICVIVSIGLDHTSILGNTLEDIAREKAGIIKPGIPVVIGEMHPAAEDTICRIAHDNKAPVWRMGREVIYREEGRGWTVETPAGSVSDLTPSIPGAQTPHNMALAVAGCFAAGSIKDASFIREAVHTTWLPGRMDVRQVDGVEVVFDGAHNADAARILVKSLPDRVRLVSNMLSGHEAAPFYRAFCDRVVGVEVAPIDSPRAMPVDDTVRMLVDEGIPARGHHTVGEALQAAIAEKDATVVVCGSNYLVGDALRAIG